MDIKVLSKEYLHYLEHIRGYSKTTIKTYANSLKLVLEEAHLEKEGNSWRLDIMSYRIKNTSLHKRTIYARISCIKNFVSYLNEIKGLSVKLFGDEQVKLPKTLPKPLEFEHIKQVLDASNEQTRLIILLFYTLGLRISELSNLELSKISNGWVRVIGKGNKERIIALLPEIEQEINAYIAKKSPKKYLFEKAGKKLEPHHIRYKMQKAFKAFGIKATPHQLRHSFASHLLGNGASIANVSKLLGHASMATTQIYTKLSSSNKLTNYLKAHPLAK